MSLRHKEKTWVSAFFVGLPIELKLFWQFIIDHADQAGFFDVEAHLPRLAMLLPEGALQAARKAFEPRVCFWSDTLWQIRGFVPEQYPRDYTQKPNGAIQGALKALLRYSSVYGTGVFDASFAGVPLWPELRSEEGGGGSSQLQPPAGGCSDLQPAAVVGEGGRGRKGPRSTPPPSRIALEVQNDSAPYKEKKAPENHNPANVRADAEKWDPPGPDISADSLSIVVLDMTFRGHGIIGPDWPPFVKTEVLKSVNQVGIASVDHALRDYLNEGKHEPSPLHFNRRLSTYLDRVPLKKRRCHGPHTFEGVLLPRDDFDNGPKLRAKVCGWCKHVAPTEKTVEASTERPVCAHDWQPQPVDLAFFAKLSPEMQATARALEQCAGCGDVRDNRVEVAA